MLARGKKGCGKVGLRGRGRRRALRGAAGEPFETPSSGPSGSLRRIRGATLVLVAVRRLKRTAPEPRWRGFGTAGIEASAATEKVAECWNPRCSLGSSPGPQEGPTEMRVPIRIVMAAAALSGVAALAVPSLEASQAPPAPAKVPQVTAEELAALTAELDLLGEELETAQQAYYRKLGELYAPYREREPNAEEEAELRKQIEAIADPSKSFVPRFEALAVRARGTVVAAKAWLRVVGLDAEAEAPTPEGAKPAERAFDRALRVLIGEHIEREELAELASTLGEWNSSLEQHTALMTALREKSPHAMVKAAATRSLAQRFASSDPERAKALYRELATNYADIDAGWGGTFGAIAERALYELEHLQVGMVAPDFEATDENGVKFKVSDYHGKVVVLDFWGFW